jgi:hypothetical protein
MATAKKRSSKSAPASAKAADKTVSSTATKAGSKGASKGGARKAAARKDAPSAKTAKPSKGAAPIQASRSARTGTSGKAARKAGPARRAGTEKVAGTGAKAAGTSPKRPTGQKGSSTRLIHGDAALFAPLSDGERAEALRLLTEDQRIAGIANVGRYRVIAVEPLAVKAPIELSSHRLARAMIYDYSSERSVEACIDLDTGKVTALKVARTQPMLSREEESTAIAIALADEQVKGKLAPGDKPQVAMHYWSRSDTSLAYSRRAAAVLFGQAKGAPSLIAVVDLLDNLVCEIVPAAEW